MHNQRTQLFFLKFYKTFETTDLKPLYLTMVIYIYIYKSENYNTSFKNYKKSPTVGSSLEEKILSHSYLCAQYLVPQFCTM